MNQVCQKCGSDCNAITVTTHNGKTFCGACAYLPQVEWQPSKKEYLRVEDQILKMMRQIHEQKLELRGLAVLWIISITLIAFKVLLG